uniref:DEAD/DEAH box helicase n=1 Tax=Holdemania filiformis TaxID=61171 RepID=UPI00266FE4C1
QLRRRQMFSQSEQLIETYVNAAVLDDPTLLQSDPVGLLPEVIFSNSELLVSFRIGRKKKYILKNLGEFLARMNEAAIVSYGKELQFLHVPESFDEVSQKILRFIRRNYPTQTNFDTGARYVKLTGGSVDDFYELFLNHPVMMADGRPMVMIEENPQFTLQVEGQGQDYQLTVTPHEYRYLASNEADYVYVGGTLIRLLPRYRILCGPLLKRLQKGSKLLVSHEQIKNFYYNVLQPVSELIPVLGMDELPVRLDPLVTRVYIDEPTPHTIMITIRFCYGANEYIGFDTLTNRDNRNLRKEQKVRAIIRQYVTRIDTLTQIAWIEKNETKEFSFLAEGVGKLMDLAEVYICESLKNVQIRSRASFSVGVRLTSGLLELQLDSPQLTPQELEEIFCGYQQKKKYVRLKNGDYFAIGEGETEEVLAMLDALQVDPKQLGAGSVTLENYRALALNERLMSTPEIKVERDQEFKTMIRDFKNIEESKFDVPPSMRKILRTYQKEGFRWLKTIAHYGFGGILADDMGIGKTLQMIAVLEDARLQGEGGCSLVVTPASLILNWQAEIRRFAPQLKCGCVHGTLKERQDTLAAADDFDVLITSYDYVKRDEALYQPLAFQYLVLDEAQAIKNQRTKSAQAVKQIQARHRFALTGTPIENSLAELWSIFDFLMPGYLFSYAQFKENYELPIVRYDDEERLTLLKKLVSPFILRRVKQDVLKELPEKTESVLQIEFSEAEKKLYQASLQQIQTQLTQTLDQQTNAGSSKIMILAMLTRLRQICCDPGLVFDGYGGERSKLSACMELIENAVESGKKILVFSQFTTILDKLRGECEKRGIGTYLLTGATPKQQRFDLMESFNRDKTPVFLISLKAGGTGLNLTGAEIVIHYDPWWNLSAENQATDRAYRIGQTRNVQVVKLIVEGTVEEKISKLQQQKQQLSQSVIEGSDGSIAAMSREEILELFETEF